VQAYLDARVVHEKIFAGEISQKSINSTKHDFYEVVKTVVGHVLFAKKNIFLSALQKKLG
jgi:hypothetical protein